jgi:hypothetical protein
LFLANTDMFFPALVAAELPTRQFSARRITPVSTRLTSNEIALSTTYLVLNRGVTIAGVVCDDGVLSPCSLC